MGRKKKQEDEENDLYVGRRVEKSFKGFGKYTGSVVGYNAARGFYKVVYDDGDREELELDELQPILRHVDIDAPASGKRGRHPKKEESQEVEPDLKRQKSELFSNESTPGSRRRESGDSICINRKRSLVQPKTDCDESDNDGGYIEGYPYCAEEDRKNGAVGQLDDKGELNSGWASKRRKQRQDQEFSATFRPAKPTSLSARGKSIQNKSLLQSFDDTSGGDDSGDYVDESEADTDEELSSPDDESMTGRLICVPEESKLPAPIPLPPSSETFPLSDDLVAEAFSVYSFLRSFSHALFLSPFSFDDFISALIAEMPSNLIDSIHLILLQALRRHLQRLSKDDCRKAQNCLRQLDWNLLDNVTWPSFLMVFLATQGFAKSYGQHIGSLRLLHTEFYKASRKVKLAVLSFLCDHALETEEIRTVIDARELEFESQLGPRDARSDNVKPSDMPEVLPELAMNEHGTKSDTSHEASSLLTNFPKAFEEGLYVDGNSDECVLCGMNGNLICCDGCPAAYHSRCVGIARASLPPGQWFCPECIVEKVGGRQSRQMKGLEGCHTLGVDSYGRTYMVACGHLLVLNKSDATEYNYSYYSEHDIQQVLQILELQAPFCADVARAIRHFWDMPSQSSFPENTVFTSEGTGAALSEAQSRTDELIHSIVPVKHEVKGIDNKQLKDASCDLSLPRTTASDASRDTFPQDMTISAANSPSKSNFLLEAPPDETNTGEGFELAILEDAAAVQRIEKNPFEIAQQVQCDMHEKLSSSAPVSAQTQYAHVINSEQDPFLAQKIVDRDIKGRFLTASSRELLPSETAHKLVPREHVHADRFKKINSYINHYVFGDAAATAAANLALMTGDETEPPERGTRKLRKTGVTIAEQISAFCKAPARFCWPSSRKKLMEAPKDRCGWCFSCLACMKRGCLLNQAASQLAAGASRVSGGIRPGKYGSGHLPTIVGYILHMEEVLQSFLVGPWDNLLFRKHWRKKVEQAGSICDLKVSLLDLEANLRPVVFTEDWSKKLEDAPYIALKASVTSNNDVSFSKKTSGKKSFRRSGACRQGLPKAGNKNLGNMQWARRGKVMRRVLGLATIVTRVAKKAGRQGGLKNIEGMLYDTSEEVPRRTKQMAWRARVQAACTAAELAVQVRCLDCLLRWDDLSSKSEVPSKVFEEDHGKEIMSSVVYAKSVHDNLVMYLIDAKCVPRQSLRQNAPSIALPQSHNSQQVWVEERQMPLHLLKEFEDKERASKQSQAPKLASIQKYLTETKQRFRKDVFRFLWERAGFSTPSKIVMSIICKFCSSKVLAGSAVQCCVCKGSFHAECTVPSHATGKHEEEHTCCGCLKSLVQKRSTLLHGVTQKVAASSLKEGSENTKSAVNPLNNQKRIVISQPWLQPVTKLAVKLPPSTLGLQIKKDSSKEISQGLHINAVKNVERNLSEGVYWRKNGTSSRMRFEKNLLFPIQGDHCKEAPRCFACKQQFKGDLIFLKCEFCPLWFHGDAVGVKKSNLDDVLGFKCNKCRKKAVPSCPYGTSSRSHKRVVRASPAVVGRSNLVQEPCMTKRSPLPFPNVADNRAEQQMTLPAQKFTPTFRPMIKNHSFVNGFPALGLQLFELQIPSNLTHDKHQVQSDHQSNPGRLQHSVEHLMPSDIMEVIHPCENHDSPMSLPSTQQQSIEANHFDQQFDVHTHIDCSSSEDCQIMSVGDDEAQVQDDAMEDGSTNGESSAQPTLSFMELLSSEDDRVEELAEVAMDFGAEGFDVFDIETILGDVGSMDLSAKDDLRQFVEFDTSNARFEKIYKGDDVCSVCGDASQHSDVQCIGCGLNMHQHCLDISRSGTGMWLSHGWACDGCKGRILQGQG